MNRLLLAITICFFISTTNNSLAYSDISTYDNGYNSPIYSPLNAEDETLYNKIFELQEKALWTEADKLIDQLDNDILLGYIQYQRYMHKDYRSKYSELKAWLDKYYGLPEAEKIYITVV